MKHHSIPNTVPLRRLSLALTLGTIAGCGTMPDAPSAGPSLGETVGSTEQAFDQIFAEPHPFEVPAAKSCDEPEFEQHRKDLLAPALTDIEIRCSLTLRPPETIRRPIRFGGRSSGVILNCQDRLRPPGSPKSIVAVEDGTDAIRIASSYPFPFEVREDGMYEVTQRPENIWIHDCSIVGRVTLVGISHAPDRNHNDFRHTAVASHDTDGPLNRDADDHPLYVARARALAPTNILFSKVRFEAPTRVAIYMWPGVNRVTIMDSVVEGIAWGDPGIYLDAETTEITILNSTLRVESLSMKKFSELAWWDTFGREQVAIDGSSYNFLVGNRVSGLNNGGFNLYRNCGERGLVRYSTPSYNVIVNNQFNYKNYKLSNWSRNRYAVHLSSRNGPYHKKNDYCSHDLKEPDGSTHDDFPQDIDTGYTTKNDNAHDNIVTNNQFLNRSPKDYLRVSSKLNNFTALNREVSDFSDDKKACFSPRSFGRVLLHGNKETSEIEPGVCQKRSCDNGALTIVDDVPCPSPSDPIFFECHARNDNNGCSNVLSCPVGKRVKSVKAACNLEEDDLHLGHLANVNPGLLQVVKASDNSSEGKCYALGTAVSVQLKPIAVQTISSYPYNGQSITFPHESGVRSVNIGCYEKDRDGGDCAVLAEFTCE